MLRRTFFDSPVPFPQLEIARRAEPQGVRLIVSGEIDLASVSALDRELRAVEHAGRRIVLDFAALTFIDSTGMHMLIEAQHRADANGHELTLTHVPAHARRLFRITGIDALLTIE